MEKTKKIKFFLGITYFLIVLIFLWVFFSKYSLQEIASYEFIKNNRDYLISIKNSNYFLTISMFLTISVIWVMLLGFGTPVCLIGGFIFGKWTGTLVVLFGLSIGATLLYIFSNFFLKEIVEKKFSKRFKTLNKNFKKNEFIFFLIYRFVGGIPFFISNILPTLFNIKIKNFFFGSILGLAPQIFIWVSLGSGFEEVISKNLTAPTVKELFFSPEIFIPIIGFVTILIIGIFIKRLFYNN